VVVVVMVELVGGPTTRHDNNNNNTTRFSKDEIRLIIAIAAFDRIYDSTYHSDCRL
jgi:citrate lyase alpha subunit